MDHQHTIATLWSLSLDQLRALQPAAAQLLRLCAYLAPVPIPLNLFADHPERLPVPLGHIAGVLGPGRCAGNRSAGRELPDCRVVEVKLTGCEAAELDGPPERLAWVALQLVRAIGQERHVAARSSAPWRSCSPKLLLQCYV
jgi:hypothetical protein